MADTLGRAAVDARDDRSLLDAWAAGDRDAGEALFARYFEAVVRFFQNKLSRDHDDLIQQTFLGCVESRAGFRGDGSFRAFLFGVAHNVLGKHLRRRYREPAALDFAQVSIAELGDSPSLVVAVDRQQQVRAGLAAALDGADLLVPVHREARLRVGVTHHDRPQEDHQVGALAVA